MKNDNLIKSWIDAVVSYLISDGYQISSDEDGDYYMTFPDRYGNTKIWINDFKFGITLKIYTDPSLFDSYELVNLINRKSDISKLVVNEDNSAAAFCLYIPYLTNIDEWLQECIDNFMMEIKIIHKNLK